MWMSRSLGAEAVGLYQICISVILLLLALTAGAPTVLSRKVAEAAANGDTKRQNGLTSAMIAVSMSVAILMCAILYACNKKLGFLFADDRCVPLFLIMLPAIITSTLYAPIRSWFWGRKNFIAFSSTELIDEIVKIVLAVLFSSGLISALNGVTGVALALTISDLVCVLILLIMFFVSGGRITKPTGTRELIKATLPLSAMRIMTALSASLTALIIPERLIAGGMTTALATAEYGRIAGMALPLIMAPVTLVASLSVVLIPDVASLNAKEDYTTIKAKLNASIIFAALVSGLFFALYLPLGEQLGILFFKDAQAGKFVSYCSLLIFPISLSQVTTPMLNSLGMERRTFTSYVAGLCVMLPCVLFLPDVIGVYAMAVGSGLGFLITGIINLASLSKKLKGLQGKELKKAVSTVGFSLPLGILGFLAYRLLAPYLGGSFGAVITGFFVTFFFIIFVSAFDVIDFKSYVVLIKPTRTMNFHRHLFKHKNPKTSSSIRK